MIVPFDYVKDKMKRFERRLLNMPTTVTVTVAFCVQASVFLKNQIFRREVAASYPGALYLPELARRLALQGINMMTGDVVLHQIRIGQLHPSQVLVIQDDRSAEAEELLRLGAKGKVLLCCESPLFADDFYRNLPAVSRKFDHCIVFRGALKDAFPVVSKHALCFPSFDPEAIIPAGPWHTRKHIVMVAGNKYWSIQRSPFRQVAAKFRDFVLRRPRRFSKVYASAQLHDCRLGAISHFGHASKLDLFGGGWDNLQNLPIRWQNELSAIISRLNPTTCASKLTTIANYRFALCFENMEFPGYVTEKVIDCLVAGVVPIYWGAPDIRNFIPEECFIDSRAFGSLYALEARLEKISEREWREIVDCGNSFLKSPSGLQYTYRGFAERIEAMLIS